jgi:hypothetical protein
MADRATWSIEYRLREDEERVFVPVALLPSAQPGDLVDIRSTQPSLTRTGRIVDHENDAARGEFVTVLLDADGPHDTAS